MQQISGMDEFFLYFEKSGLPMHVGSLAVFDCSKSSEGTPTFAQIREGLCRGAERSPMLRKRLLDVPMQLDRPYWLEAQKLEITEHVRHVTLPRPRSWARFCSEVARLFESPLDFERPLWEALVITDLDGVEGTPPGGFAVLTKAHHVMLDGVAGVELMSAFLDESPEPAEHEVVDRRRPDGPPGVFELVSRAAANRMTRAGTAAGLAARTLPAMLQKQASSWGAQAEPTDTAVSSGDAVGRTVFNGRPSSARVFGGIKLELQDVQLLRQGAKGATVNDVIMAICGGALRGYLQATEDLPEQSLVAMAPVAIREAGSGMEGGNQVSMMTVDLGSDIADPLARLRHVCATARSSKKQGSSTGATTMLDIAELIPSALGQVVARAYRTMDLSSRHAPFVNCVVTNVPGPRESLYLAGAKMDANYGLGPIFDGIGLIHPVLSYDDSITIAFTSCPSMVREPALYTECLRRAFEELRAAVDAPGTSCGESNVMELRVSGTN